MNTRATSAALRHRLTGHRGIKILLAAAGATALTATIMGSPAGAVSGVTGTGSPACDSAWTGTMSFSPSLRTNGTATNVGVVVKANFNCAGGAPPPSPAPSSGAYIAKGVVHMAGANNCANWFGAYPGPYHLVPFTAPGLLTGGVTWAPVGINPSGVKFPSVEILTGLQGRLIITLPAPLPAAGTVTGSYAPKAHLTLRTAQTYGGVTNGTCTTGLSTLNIVASNPGGISQGTF